ncbi:phosphoglycerate kinase [Rhodospirillaceae bacterium KN72]|uniref:Phosphoglycerate kinase n=1 Tax=Pacificispira spongiicola TaxID=2729598 RepID=A0A7Y0HET1_9PROT|nr:phosphoglycerate kinase [Pacificispira spongiicola]NMM43237.1 phosphoglycerate kinase [Pacificispira spongiicola]
MFKTIDDVSLTGKVALVRADLNVPMRDGAVTDATRIERLRDTVDDLIAGGAKVVLMSHFGRPKGKVVPEMSLEPVAEAVVDVLGRPVVFAADCIGAMAADAIAAAADGTIVVLENLRFHAGEEADDAAFAKELADLGDIYVNDAFSAAHRAHASTHAIAGLLPAVAGRNMQAELEALESALGAPERPVAAIVGGAKVSTKLAVLNHLVEKVDLLIIGGGMANTFLHAMGKDIAKSLCEKDLADTAREILARADAAGCRIGLPHDVTVASEFAAGAASESVPLDAVQADKMILDIGPETAAALCAELENCRTLIWNGPMGAFEIPPFDAGTVALARKAAALTKAGTLISVAGGGDTVAALAAAGVSDDFTYVSTAGGAFLEWMEGRELPGVAALNR